MRIEANPTCTDGNRLGVRDGSQTFVPPGLVSFAIGLDPTTPGAFALWKASQWYEPGEPCLQIREPMPPIRCTMPVPCGVCWYCKQHEARK